MEWRPNWRERIAEAANASGADLIIKTVSRHSGLTRRFKATSDWIEGTPYRAIAEATRELESDILVIGSANLHVRDSSSIIGDTAERIIDAVDTDLVVIPNG